MSSAVFQFLRASSVAFVFPWFSSNFFSLLCVYMAFFGLLRVCEAYFDLLQVFFAVFRLHHNLSAFISYRYFQRCRAGRKDGGSQKCCGCSGQMYETDHIPGAKKRPAGQTRERKKGKLTGNDKMIEMERKFIIMNRLDRKKAGWLCFLLMFAACAVSIAAMFQGNPWLLILAAILLAGGIWALKQYLSGQSLS